MSATAAALVKAAILALTDENTRKKIGWVLAAILSPVILLIAFLCALGSGTASHNLSVVELCFYGGKVPSETPDEYRASSGTFKHSLKRNWLSRSMRTTRPSSRKPAVL